MLSSLIATAIIFIIRLVLGSLAASYNFLTEWLPYVNYVLYAFLALTALFAVIKIFKALLGGK